MFEKVPDSRKKVLRNSLRGYVTVPRKVKKGGSNLTENEEKIILDSGYTFDILNMDGLESATKFLDTKNGKLRVTLENKFGRWTLFVLESVGITVVIEFQGIGLNFLNIYEDCAVSLWENFLNRTK